MYFDTIKFAANENHEYAKLVPEAVGDLDALAEGEGEYMRNYDKLKDRWKCIHIGIFVDNDIDKLQIRY